MSESDETADGTAKPARAERAKPALLVFGAIFIAIGLLTRDQWAFYAGGALLVVGWLQITR